jgi:alpha-tubulin suppressor-like RCC1 family protein
VIITAYANGDVWVWGNNSKYQLGNGTTVNSSVPVKMTTVSGIVNISGRELYPGSKK